MSTLSTEMRDMLVDSARKFVDAEYAFESRQKLASSETGYSEELWTSFAELGWLAIPFAEEYDGLGGELVDMAGLAEQFGTVLVLEPWFASVALAGQAIANSSNDTLKADLIPAIASGEKIVTLAWEEQESAGNPQHISTTADADASGFRLNGEKILVLSASVAHGFIVTAKIKGSENTVLFYVPANSSGVSLISYKLVDGSRAATVLLDNVLVDNEHVLTGGESECAPELLRQTIDNGIYLLCSEALGSMAKLLQTTADYMLTRKQFGAPLATFQSLRHFLADMYVILKKTRCYHHACTNTLRRSGQLSSKQVSTLKAQTGRAAHHIGRQAIQIHGGIGMTDELDVGHYVKRLTSIDALLGNGRYHLQSIANNL